MAAIPKIKRVTITPNPVDTGAAYHVTVEFDTEEFHGTTAHQYASGGAEPDAYAGDAGALA